MQSARLVAAILTIAVSTLHSSWVWAETTPPAVVVRIKCELQDTAGASTTRCQNLNGWFEGTLEWVSNGTVVFQENGPFFGMLVSDEVLILPNGNGNPAVFDAVYVEPATSIFTASNLTLRLYVQGQRGLTLAVEQPYLPQASALWAKHSEDSFGLQAGIDAEAAARSADHAALEGKIAVESAARSGADTLLQQNLNAEAATRASADAALQGNIASEAATRSAADAALQASTNTKVTSVSASAPISSSGGTTPNIALTSCAEGQVLKFTSGQWRCVNGPGTGTVVRRISATSCFQQGLPGIRAEMRLGNFNPLETEGIGSRTTGNSITLYCPIPSDSLLPHANIDRVEVRGWGSSLCDGNNCPPFVLAYLCVSYPETADGECSGFLRSEVRGANYAITFTGSGGGLFPWANNPNGYPYVRVNLTIPSYNGDTSTLRGITVSGRSGL